MITRSKYTIKIVFISKFSWMTFTHATLMTVLLSFSLNLHVNNIVFLLPCPVSQVLHKYICSSTRKFRDL